ncbi:MAG: peptide chain release factor N(5)-glutamine methyltransferase [Lachnospiraceae bacterium]|nr:peptide chain release factor N(5)-glutamine methyltransferase [Lachnospiraceae bacterium]
MTYRELYDYGTEKLKKADIAEAALDARLLLEYICRTDRNALLVHGESERSPLEEEFYKRTIEQRSAHIPLQHITGEQEFMGLSFCVNEHTLIPRQDTEILVEEAMRHMSDGMRILDLCTGSGCIILSLLKYSNECEGIGIDISKDALLIAEENAKRLGLSAAFLEGDLFEPLEGYVSDKTHDRLFDIVISNPPYIASGVIPTLMPEVKDHEPLLALDGKEDGLYFYREIIKKAPSYMRKSAMIFFEIGYDQADAVSVLLQESGFQEIEVIKDYAGLDRVVKANLEG